MNRASVETYTYRSHYELYALVQTVELISFSCRFRHVRSKNTFESVRFRRNRMKSYYNLHLRDIGHMGLFSLERTNFEQQSSTFLYIFTGRFH